MRVSRQGLWAMGLGAVLLVACRSTPPVEAEAETAQVGLAIPNEEYVEDPVICRRQRVIGSHVPVRVCKTKSQMEADRRAAQRAIGPLRPSGGSTHQPDAPGTDPR